MEASRCATFFQKPVRTRQPDHANILVAYQESVVWFRSKCLTASTLRLSLTLPPPSQMLQSLQARINLLVAGHSTITHAEAANRPTARDCADGGQGDPMLTALVEVKLLDCSLTPPETANSAL